MIQDIVYTAVLVLIIGIALKALIRFTKKNASSGKTNSNDGSDKADGDENITFIPE